MRIIIVQVKERQDLLPLVIGLTDRQGCRVIGSINEPEQRGGYYCISISDSSNESGNKPHMVYTYERGSMTKEEYKATEQVPSAVVYSDVVVKIVREEGDVFDGHTTKGFTEKEDSPTYSFRTNFPKAMLSLYMKAIESCGFPAGTVGINEEATGYNEDTGSSFKYSGGYGLYFLEEEIPENVMLQYRSRIEHLLGLIQ